MRKPRKQFPGATAYFDRHGKRRWRYRRKGFTASLGTDYGSPEFVARYEAALKQHRLKGRIGESRTKSGTISALLVSYYRSQHFMSLAPSTRQVYRNLLERFREQHGEKRVDHLKRRHVQQLIAEKADRPSAANNLLKRLRTFLDHAVELEWIEDNPARRTKLYPVSSDGFHSWTDDEIARFYQVHKQGSLAHTAMTLMLFTGAAKADAVRLGWGNVHDERLTYRRIKTRKQSDVVVDIPIHPSLAVVLDLLPREAFTFLQTPEGKSRSPNGLGNMMRKWCDEAELPECTSHGLRKACARRLADAGATPHEIQAVTGHKTLKEVERYTASVGRARLADTSFQKLSAWSEREQTLANQRDKLAKPDD